MAALIKWLQNNNVGIVLSAACGFLLFVLLVLTILSSLPLSSFSPGNDAGNSDPGLDLPTLAENLPIDSYSVITERPLFNQTRNQQKLKNNNFIKFNL